MRKVIPLVNVESYLDMDRKHLTREDIAADHRWNFIQRKMSFEKDLGLKGKYCYHPFNTITVDKYGDVYVCVCQAWLPINVGNILEFDSLDDIVRSPKAREIQASIIDGSYRYCDHNSCGIIQAGELEDKIDHRPDTVNWINFVLDPSCNLTCPSCRKDFIFVTHGPEFDKLIKIVDKLVTLIEQHDHWIKFSISNDGDPFASLVYRNLLSKLNVKGKDVEVEIVTNGLLAKDHWHKMEGIWDNVVRFKVSFDAATEDVYNITRRGGNWKKLLDSVRYIVDWKKSRNSSMEVMANFVVQNANYKDMPAYVQLCEELGITEIYFQKITDWGTFDNFAQEAVWMNTHPNHADFIQILNHPLLKNNKVNLTNLTDLLNSLSNI